MNAPPSTLQSQSIDRASRQAQVVAALKQVLPAHALLSAQAGWDATHT